MGAGKSTLGPPLARRLGWRFVDLDEELVRQHRATIAELFHAFGEDGFRRLESAALSTALAMSNIVLALGGGAIEMAGNRELLARSSTLLIYLEAPIEELIARCERQPGAAVRPVLQRRAELLERFLRRRPWYEQADWTVATTGRQPDELADELAGRLPFACGQPAHNPEDDKLSS